MPCPAATGNCSVPANAPGEANKSYNAGLGLISGALVQGYADHFTLSWTAPLSAAQQVRVAYYGNNLDRSLPPVASNAGPVSSATGLASDLSFTLFARIENSTQYGPWLILPGFTDPAWNSNSVIVEHLGEPVLFGSDIVLMD